MDEPQGFRAIRGDIEHRIRTDADMDDLGQLRDLTEECLDQLTAEQRASWTKWQDLRTTPAARRQRSLGFTALLSTALLAGLGGVASLGSPVSTIAANTAAVVSLLLVLLTLVYEKELSTHPGYLPLLIRIHLGHKVRRRISLQPLRDSLTHQTGHPSRNDEAHVLIVATEVIRSIRLSPAWHTRYLDQTFSRYDLQGELAVLARAAVYLYQQRTLESTGGAGARMPSDHALWLALSDRVAWLQIYHRQLSQLIDLPPNATGRAGHGDRSEPAPSAIHDLRWTVTVLQETRLPHDER